MRLARGLTLLPVFLLGLAISASAQDQRRIETTENADYYGYDLRTEKDVTLEQCEATCLDDQQCRAFTYNTSAEWCFLKSDFNQINPAEGAIAGKVIIGETETVAKPDIGAPPALSFLSDQVRSDAKEFHRNTLQEAQGEVDSDFDMYLSMAESAIYNDDTGGAISPFSEAVALRPDQSRLWIGLAHAALMTDADSDSRWSSSELQQISLGAAVNAYETSRNTDDRAEALDVLARALELNEQYRPALSAYEASLELQNSPDVQERYADLKSRKGFRVLDHSIDADSASPRACVQFSEDLVKSGVDYTQYVTVDNAPGFAVDRGEAELCITGLKHGEYYRIAIRQGLPAAIGEIIPQPVSLEIYVRDRDPSMRFTGDNFVLPTSARRGIPLVSVNAEAAKLSVYRIGDRALTQLLSSSNFLNQLDGYSRDYVADQMGEPVWEGEIDISPEQNKDVVTSIPIDEAVPNRKPGVYMMTAQPVETTDNDDNYYDDRATQWFLVSDIGLSTFAGQDSLSVFARSLETAEPMEDVKLSLLAQNNEILGEAVTDRDGRAEFDPGLVRGNNGLAPAAILAQKGDEDFVFLDMTRAGFDLSDRGVEGREAPGPLDIFVWTERGIYRAGEIVHATALARSPASDAEDDLPLTFIIRRPDGVQALNTVSEGAELGGHMVKLDLPENAMRGTWHLAVYSDPDQPPLVEKMFLVEDFVPDRTEIKLASADEAIPVGGATDITVNGDYLYGAPAAGLSLDGQLTVKPTQEWKAFPGYVFGLDDEEDVETMRVPLEGLPMTDENGQAVFPVSLDSAPATTRLLTANVSVQMREAGGRAVERALNIDVQPETNMIGIKPEFSDGVVEEGSTANFWVIAVDAMGQRIAMPGLKWSLIRLEQQYIWYRDGSSWQYEPITKTSLVQEGTVDALADSEAQIGISVDWGRYRLEVEGPQTGGAISSVSFDSGWYVEAGSTETPDGLEVALDREAYAVGDTARLQISPRFAGEVLVTIGSETILETYTASVPEEGTTLDIPVTEKFGAGAYVTATLFRPGSDTENRLPMRSIGVQWLQIDPAQLSLTVDLGVAEQTKPNEPLAIPVSLTGLEAGEEAYVTVAAVDVGILNLTRYEAPDAKGWYFGQRKLGLELRDIYGRLIDGSLGATGKLRTGGDGANMEANGNPPTQKLVAFHSGIVRVDDSGKADITFDIPQFNGTARVMAVAWSKKAVGNASKDVIIRDPVVLTTSQPRFLAPGDQARMLLEVANTDGPAGDYRLTVAGIGPVSIGQGTPETLTLDKGATTALSIPISAAGATGEAGITVSLTHDSGLNIQKNVSFPVRPGIMPVATQKQVTLQPNGGGVVLDYELLADSFAEGASVTVNVSRNTGFDVPALLMSLDRNPYGCAEQTTSRALPLLYVSELSKAAGMEDDPEIAGRIDDAIKRVLSYQSSAGGFGLWGPDSGDLWLSAYVTDFLTRAREQGFTVPDRALEQALRNLQNSLSYDTDVEGRGSEIAYALYVLARNRKASAGDLRYYLDTRLDEFHTPLARAQLAASLALYGDAGRAETGFASAFRLAQDVSDNYSSYSDYGSSLRDGAAMLALAVESRPEPASVLEMVNFVSNTRNKTRYLSTQDQAWMLLAARALSRSNDDISLTIDGASHNGAFAKRIDGEQINSEPMNIVNQGGEPVTAMITTSAAPRQPLPAGGEGFSITRTYYTLEGEEISITNAKQNERYVVVLEIMEDSDLPSRVLVSDLLPAGLEIDNPRLVDSSQLENFDWLGNTSAVHTEFRDDRFIAAFDRGEGDKDYLRLAYVVRAVTPGVFMHPAASVEDMYRPQYSARTSTGFMEISGN